MIKGLLNIIVTLGIIYLVLLAISYYSGAAFRGCVLSPNSEILKLCYQSQLVTDKTVPYLVFGVKND